MNSRPIHISAHDLQHPGLIIDERKHDEEIKQQSSENIHNHLNIQSSPNFFGLVEEEQRTKLAMEDEHAQIINEPVAVMSM